MTPRKLGFSLYGYFRWTSEGAQLLNLEKEEKILKCEGGQIRPENPASFWPDSWPDCPAILKKNLSLLLP